MYNAIYTIYMCIPSLHLSMMIFSALTLLATAASSSFIFALSIVVVISLIFLVSRLGCLPPLVDLLPRPPVSPVSYMNTYVLCVYYVSHRYYEYILLCYAYIYTVYMM